MPLRHARLTVGLKDTACEVYCLAYVNAVVLKCLLDAHSSVHVHELRERHRGDVRSRAAPLLRAPHVPLSKGRLTGVLLRLRVFLTPVPELVHETHRTLQSPH